MLVPAPLVSLGPHLVDKLFPFLLAFDRGLRLVQHGRVMPKICQPLSLHVTLDALFRVVRPRIDLSFITLQRESHSIFLLDSRSTRIRLRGQMIYDEASDALLFIGTPWFTDIRQLEETDLALSDFNVHDPIADFLYMVQAQRLALEDAQAFSETIVRQRDQLERANQELTEAVAAKSQFLANTSHELRTPLNGIIGMTTLLLRADLTGVQRGYADKILRSAESLLAVVNDVLDFSKMEAGKLSLDCTEVEIWDLLYEVAEMAAVSAQQKGLELLCQIEPEVPQVIRGDGTRLRQVLSNLLNNAVKFTERGTVALRVMRLPHDANGPNHGADEGADTAPSSLVLRFEVQDSGIGVTEEQQGRLFNAFSQADGSMSRRFGGTGLGLAICKQLVGLMGGEIGLRSTPASGSTFWFSAPLRLLPERPGGAPWAEGAPLLGIRVLIVDDNDSGRVHLLSLLRAWGAAAEEAQDGMDALQRLRAAGMAGPAAGPMAGFDLLLLDTEMPRLSGLDLALVIGGDASFDALRVVLLGPVSMAGGGAAALQRVRFDALLTKPVRAPLLLRTIQDLVGRRSSPPRRTDPPALPPEPAPPAWPPAWPGVGPGLRRILVVDDHPVNLEVAVNMVRALGYEGDVARSGDEALVALRAAAYDLVLMDLQMPGLDGYTTTAEIRKREGEGRHTPVIALTAHAMEADRARALQAGLDDYLAKPVRLEVLGATLSRWLAPPEPAPPGPAPPGADRGGAARSLAPRAGAGRGAIDRAALEALRKYQRPGRPDLVAEVLGRFLSDFPERVQAVRRGREQGDVGLIRQTAHALKSSSATVGATGLSQLCGEIEAGCEAGRGAGPEMEALLRRFLAQAEEVRQALEAMRGGG